MLPENPTWERTISQILSHTCMMYLWDRVLVERGVLACHVEYIEGNNVAHSLDFMDDCISIGHVLSVSQRGLSGWTNDSVDLCLDSLCTQWQQETVWVCVDNWEENVTHLLSPYRSDLWETSSTHLQNKQAGSGTDITQTHLVCEDSGSCITVPIVTLWWSFQFQHQTGPECKHTNSSDKNQNLCLPPISNTRDSFWYHMAYIIIEYKENKKQQTQIKNTHLSHLCEEAVDVVSRWRRVETFFVFSDLDFNEVKYLLCQSENPLVRSRQPLHQPVECVINLQRIYRGTRSSENQGTVHNLNTERVELVQNLGSH